jgi:hypothetical protein
LVRCLEKKKDNARTTNVVKLFILHEKESSWVDFELHCGQFIGIKLDDKLFRRGRYCHDPTMRDQALLAYVDSDGLASVEKKFDLVKLRIKEEMSPVDGEKEEQTDVVLSRSINTRFKAAL